MPLPRGTTADSSFLSPSLGLSYASCSTQDTLDVSPMLKGKTCRRTETLPARLQQAASLREGNQQEVFLSMLWEVQSLVDRLQAQYQLVRQEFNDTVHALRMENSRTRFEAAANWSPKTSASEVGDETPDQSRVAHREFPKQQQGQQPEQHWHGIEDAWINEPMSSSCTPILFKEGPSACLPNPPEPSEAASENSLDLKVPARSEEGPRSQTDAAVFSPRHRPNLSIDVPLNAGDSIVDVTISQSLDGTPRDNVVDDSGRRAAIRRLQARLGVASDRAAITGASLYTAVLAAGLTKYSADDLTDLIERLNNAPPRSCRPQRHNRVASALRVSLQDDEGKGMQSSSSTVDSTSESINSSKISFHRFVGYLMDPKLKNYVRRDVYITMSNIADVLLAGDANRIIAELTNTRIDDLACPQPHVTLFTMVEPAVAFLILLNCLLLVFQLDSGGPSSSAWFFVDVFFFVLFFAEMALRARVTGYSSFFAGKERGWNVFDTVILALAALDLLAVSTQAPMSLRLIRLMRMLRVVRLAKQEGLRELTLVVRSFFGGLRAMVWALLLLLGALFVVAVYMRALVTPCESLIIEVPDADVLFATVHRSMFTVLRCMTGDCTDRAGNSLTVILAKKFGTQFTMVYFGAVLLISCVLFSLIVAVYVEATMSAAKCIDESSRLLRNHEAVRVARTTKTLLKRFCAAAKSAGGGRELDDSDSLTDTRRSWKALVMRQMTGEDMEDVAVFRDHESVTVTKDIYMVVIQDQRVQMLMDDLGIPLERAHLFDVLDAAGRGCMSAIDLMSGLLQVRGQARRSDVVGCKMVVQIVRDMVRDLHCQEMGTPLGPRTNRRLLTR